MRKSSEVDHHSEMDECKRDVIPLDRSKMTSNSSVQNGNEWIKVSERDSKEKNRKIQELAQNVIV